MTVQQAIEARIKYHQGKLHQAEGRYHSKAEGITEQQRHSAFIQCRAEQGILIELEALRREVTLCDEV